MTAAPVPRPPPGRDPLGAQVHRTDHGTHVTWDIQLVITSQDPKQLWKLKDFVSRQLNDAFVKVRYGSVTMWVYEGDHLRGLTTYGDIPPDISKGIESLFDRHLPG